MNRSGFLVVHRWLGLLLAPFLLLQVLTGAFLVLHEFLLPGSPVSQIGVGQFAAAASASQPGARVTRLYVPGSTGSTAFAEMAATGGSTYAEVDAADGHVLAAGGLWRFPYRLAVQLHYRLASGIAGMIAVFAIGLSLLLVATSGLTFWWPGLSRVPQALKLRRGVPARMRLRQWHRFIGAPSSLLALFSAVTGLMLIVPDILPVLAAAPTATAPGQSIPANPDTIDRAVAAAQARFPGSPLRDVRFPPADRIDVNFDAPGRNARAVHSVSVRISDGAVLRSLRAEENPVLWMKVLDKHTGQFFGVTGMFLLLAEAAALAFLAIAGVVMWLRSRRGMRQ